MLRIGNDIVELNNPYSRIKSQDTRFIERVFTRDEQLQIFSSSNPDVTLWVLWANKETAYKIAKKCDAAASFIPRFHEVSLNWVDNNKSDGSLQRGNDFFGVVNTPHGHIQTKTFAGTDYVHCVGINAPLKIIEKINWQVDRINPALSETQEHESILVRDALKKHLSQYLGICRDDIEIRRAIFKGGLGPPVVHIKESLAHIDITLSHDGCFIAHAFIESNGEGA